MNEYRRILFIIILIVIGNNITAETSKIIIKQDYIEKNQVVYINSIKNDLDYEQLSKIIDSIRNQGYFKLEIIEKVKIDSLSYKVRINLNQKFENIYIHDQGSVINFKDKEVKIIDIRNISSKSINELEELGKSLMIANRYDNQQNEIIEQIDFILLNEYNEYNNSSIGIEELKNELKEYIK